MPRRPRTSRLGGSRGVPVLVPVCASPVPRAVRRQDLKFFWPCESRESEQRVRPLLCEGLVPDLATFTRFCRHWATAVRMPTESATGQTGAVSTETGAVSTDASCSESNSGRGTPNKADSSLQCGVCGRILKSAGARATHELHCSGQANCTHEPTAPTTTTTLSLTLAHRHQQTPIAIGRQAGGEAKQNGENAQIDAAPLPSLPGGGGWARAHCAGTLTQQQPQ